MHVNTLSRAALILGVLAYSGCGGGGGGYSSPPPPTAPGGGSGAAATVTIRSDGTVDPKEVRISMGDQVRFVNQDSRAHQPQSNPHLMHTDCPAINRVGVIQAGQSATTDRFDVEKACGYHDHMNPDAAGLGGVIRVAGAEGPPGPVYIKP